MSEPASTPSTSAPPLHHSAVPPANSSGCAECGTSDSIFNNPWLWAAGAAWLLWWSSRKTVEAAQPPQTPAPAKEPAPA